MADKLTEVTFEQATQLRVRLLTMFREADADENKLLDWVEFKTLMSKLDEEMTDSEMRDLFRRMDVTNDGEIEYEAVFHEDSELWPLVLTVAFNVRIGSREPSERGSDGEDLEEKEKELSRAEIEFLQMKEEMFALLQANDADANGLTDLEEFTEAMRAVLKGISSGQILRLFEALDFDRSGYIDFNEVFGASGDKDRDDRLRQLFADISQSAHELAETEAVREQEADELSKKNEEIEDLKTEIKSLTLANFELTAQMEEFANEMQEDMDALKDDKLQMEAKLRRESEELRQLQSHTKTLESQIALAREERAAGRKGWEQRRLGERQKWDSERLQLEKDLDEWQKRCLEYERKMLEFNEDAKREKRKLNFERMRYVVFLLKQRSEATRKRKEDIIDLLEFTEENESESESAAAKHEAMEICIADTGIQEKVKPKTGIYQLDMDTPVIAVGDETPESPSHARGWTADSGPSLSLQRSLGTASGMAAISDASDSEEEYGFDSDSVSRKSSSGSFQVNAGSAAESEDDLGALPPVAASSSDENNGGSEGFVARRSGTVVGAAGLGFAESRQRRVTFSGESEETGVCDEKTKEAAEVVAEPRAVDVDALIAERLQQMEAEFVERMDVESQKLETELTEKLTTSLTQKLEVHLTQKLEAECNETVERRVAELTRKLEAEFSQRETELKQTLETEFAKKREVELSQITQKLESEFEKKGELELQSQKQKLESELSQKMSVELEEKMEAATERTQTAEWQLSEMQRANSSLQREVASLGRVGESLRERVQAAHELMEELSLRDTELEQAQSSLDKESRQRRDSEARVRMLLQDKFESEVLRNERAEAEGLRQEVDSLRRQLEHLALSKLDLAETAAEEIRKLRLKVT